MTSTAFTIQPLHPVTDEPTDWLPGQAEIWHSDQFKGGLVGGWGSGKSEYLALEALTCVYLNPGAPGALIAQTHGDTKTTLLPKFLRYLPPHPDFPDQAPIDKIDRTQLSPALDAVSLEDRWMRFTNGSTVTWGSADQRKGWMGATYGWAMADEIWLWPHDQWLKLVSRVRLPCPRPRIRFATNPSMGWMHDVCKHPSVYVVHANTKQNVHNRDGYYDDMAEGMSEQAIRVMLGGEFLPMSGQVFEQYGEKNIKPWKYTPKLTVRACMDFGFRRPYVGFAQEAGGSMIAFDEIVTQDRSTENIAHQICTRDYALEAIAVDPAGAGVSTTRGERDVDILRNILRKKWPSIRVIWQNDPALRSIPARIDMFRAAICDHTGHRRFFVSQELAEMRYPSGLMGIHQALLASIYPDKQGGISAEQPVKDGVSDHGRDSWNYYLTNFHPPHSHGQVIDIGRRHSDVPEMPATDYNF